eukprot:995644-Rhodomonas_salina.1
MGLFAVLSPLYNGKDTSYTLSPLDWLQDPCLWPAALERFRATLTVAPNFAIALTCRRLRERGLEGHYDCSTLALAIVGAEPTELKTLNEAAAVMRVPRNALHNSYGLAEHGLLVSSFGSKPAGDAGPLSAGSLAFSQRIGVHI